MAALTALSGMTVVKACRRLLDAYVRDGPYLFQLDDGTLLMLWSSLGDSGYAMGLAATAGGEITGPWLQQPEPLRSDDGGHGMVIRLPHGGLALTLHQPNSTPDERTVIRSSPSEVAWCTSTIRTE